jgi:hypothetical protein
MNPDSTENALNRQRLAFYFALFSCFGTVIWLGIRVYLAIVGDTETDLLFVTNTLGFFAIWVLSWIVGFVIVGNSIEKTKRLTTLGIAALVLLAIPATPVVVMVVTSFWRFARNL